MATEIAALGLKADSTGVVKATGDLKTLAGAAVEADRAAEKLSGGAKKADAAVRREGDAARKAANDNRQLSRDLTTADGSMHRLADSAGKLVGRMIALAGAAVSVGAYARLADSWSDMRSQLGAAIGDMDAANDMMSRMVDIANASYAPLDQTVQVYARNISVLRDLGKSASEAADFTESLNHMLVITATKGEQAASVQNALSKAMAVGRLQADGLETVLANGGRVAEALAAELNTTVSGLRQMASDGKITGQVIADAIIKPLEDVREVAGEMPATIGDAFGRIGTNLTALIGKFDQTFQITARVADGLVALADRIGQLSNIDFAGWVSAASGAMEVLAIAVIGLSATQIPALVIALASAATSFSLTAAAAGALATASGVATTALGLLRAALIAVGGPWGVLAGLVAATAAYLLVFRDNSTEAEKAIRATEEGQAALNAALGTFYQTAAPSAAKAAIGLANDNYKLAESALFAAEAELAKKQAMLDNFNATRNLGVNQTIMGPDGVMRPRGEVFGDQVAAAEAQLTRTRELLEQARAGRANAAMTVVSSINDILTGGSGSSTQNLSIDVNTPGLGGAGGRISGIGGAAAKATEDVDKLGQAIDKALRVGMEQTIETMDRGADAIGNLFTGLLDGSKSVKQGVVELIMEIAKMQMMDGFRSLFGGGGAFGGVGGWLGGLLGGARAGGGPVHAGTPYLVNERTPNSEVFVPSQSGAVLNVPQAQAALAHAAAPTKQQVEIILHAPEGFTAGQVREAQGISLKVVQGANRAASDRQYTGGGR